MSNEIQLKNFLNNNDIEVQSVRCSNTLGVDCYLIYTRKKYNINYLRKHLGNIEIYRVPKLLGECGDVLIIKVEDGYKLLKSCNFNFLDALGESNREELIKKQLIINDCGNKDTRVRFKKGSMVLLYNTDWSSSLIANALNICDDSVVDVSAYGCGDLKMVVLLDRVGKHTCKPKPMPVIKIKDFDLRTAICEAHSDNNVKRRLVSCGVANEDTYVNVSWDNLVVIQDSIGTCEEIAEALCIPKKAITKLYGDYDKSTQVIMLDRVFRRVISKECD